jgi:hypothetical protein
VPNLHLDPDSYPCPTHPAEELRPLVERALDPSKRTSPAVFGGKKKTFTVYVNCPGGGEQHAQVCTGRFWR